LTSLFTANNNTCTRISLTYVYKICAIHCTRSTDALQREIIGICCKHEFHQCVVLKCPSLDHDTLIKMFPLIS